MKRRALLVGGAAAAAVGGAGVVVAGAGVARAGGDVRGAGVGGGASDACSAAPWHHLVERDGPGVDELARMMSAGGGATSAPAAVSLLARARARIAAVDKSGPSLRAVLAENPDAEAIARRLDDEREKTGKLRGPLHGIPLLLKDNIETADRTPTTAGSLALATSRRAADAPLVQRLRAAGAVVLGKSNLSEWANFRGDRSISGWSGVGGQTRNPYALDRSPSGSSSGSAVAVAAGIVAAAVGTETDGSIVSPSSCCGIVGFKPTRGAVSGKGIVPISLEQDTAGPMARSVADAAVIFGVMRDGGAPVNLDGATLRGKRVGVARKLAGFHRDVDACFDAALATLAREGAQLVDVALGNPPGLFDAEILALTYEARRDIDAYLASLAPPVHGIRSVADVVAFDRAHAREELALFGDQTLAKAAALPPMSSSAEYAQARRSANKLAADALAAVFPAVDVVVCPTEGPAWLIDVVNGDAFAGGQSTSLPAVAGAPHCTVPMGFVRGLPVGLSFVGPRQADDDVLRCAFAFERATRVRRPPEFLRTVAVP